MDLEAQDNAGRRSGIDRRQFSYLVHVPERRSGMDRRGGVDRRILKGAILDKAKERRRYYKADLIR